MLRAGSGRLVPQFSAWSQRQRQTFSGAMQKVSTKAMSSSLEVSPLLSAQQAHQLWQNQTQQLHFVDGSWYLDPSRNGLQEFAKERLPGAVYFDLDKHSDKSVALPHMLPTAPYFGEVLTSMGISNNDVIIVYGGNHCFSAPRVWWTFKYFGHDQVFVLNGGLNKWKDEGFPVETTPVNEAKQPSPTQYKARANADLVVNWQPVLALQNGSQSQTTQIVDARAAGRFQGKEAEPRPGMRSGHMPTALNVPFANVVTPKDFSLFREKAELQKAFQDAGVSLDAKTPVITSCGSGVTACVLTLALHVLGKPLDKAPVYDGSWSEWGARKDLPVVADK